MKKLGRYFQDYHQNPVILLEAVWFLLCYHFGHRDREVWVAFRKDFSIVSQNSQGSEFVECPKTERLKNIQGGYKQKDQDYSDNRMHGESVEIFMFFLSKLNPN